MILERAEVIIKPGMMDEFLEVLRRDALPLTALCTGCLSFRALRGLEDADSAMLLAECESLEAQLASRPEPTHARFREIVVAYMSGAKATVHFQPI